MNSTKLRRMPFFRQAVAHAANAGDRWHEILQPDGSPRPVYRHLFEQISRTPRSVLRRHEDNLEATMREMGVTFALDQTRAWGARPWECDLMPQIFSDAEWRLVCAGVAQHLRAFEFFLRDMYGERAIIRSGVLPVQPTQGSPYFQRPACGLPRPDGAFLHLCGAALSRSPGGQLCIRHHYFGSASGISYMMQNRRALARVMPDFFEGYQMHSIADAPTKILETLRHFSGTMDPTVVLLSPGEKSPAYPEHSFLGRRMGIPVVQGRDLLVHDNKVYLKTTSGLEQVEAIYTRVADPWIDPLVFRPQSVLGVPGLVQCVRHGSVRVLNAIGSQLADDRALLHFTAKIIRFYLAESPVIPTVPTYWLGEIDQREYVLSHIEDFTIRSLYGENILSPPGGKEWTAAQRNRVLRELHKCFSSYVAQPSSYEAATVSFPGGIPAPRTQDHVVFGLRASDDRWEIFPGALTRASVEQGGFVASQLGGGSKDSWVLSESGGELDARELRRMNETRAPTHLVTSRVAESFYWTGRYLERAADLATMVSTIESLELEELNRSEQRLYRPVWNQMLPPLENRAAVTRRTLSSAEGRYRLALDPGESGSLVNSVLRAVSNADSIQESLSVESLVVLRELQSTLQRIKFRPEQDMDRKIAASRKVCARARSLIAEFFGTAESTMIVDAGWRFCLLGQMIERAIITANALLTITNSLVHAPAPLRGEHALEIRLSAFLRLLASRDAYRRMFQMRVEPACVADLLWNSSSAPRSVRYCLERSAEILRLSTPQNLPALRGSTLEIDSLLADLQRTKWNELFSKQVGDATAQDKSSSPLEKISEKFFGRILGLHSVITDGFLNHQVHLHEDGQRFLWKEDGHAV